MSDLISRKTVLDILQEEKSLRCGYDADIAILSIEKKIKEQQTAYDVEKVVEELEDLEEDFCQCFRKCEEQCFIQRVTDIVRKGGVIEK